MPTLENIYSANATFQLFETLKTNRTKRHKQKQFLLEGVRHINTALDNNWTVNAYLYEQNAKLSNWAQDKLNSSSAVTHYALTAELLERLSSKRNPSELLAIVDMPADDFDRIQLSQLPLLAIIDRSGNHGNLGTLIRSCDALGVDGLIMTGHSVDLYAPETIAATAGSFFAFPVVRSEPKELTAYCDQIRSDYGDLQIVATSAKADKVLYDCNFLRPTVLLIGNETHGLSRSYLEMADMTVTIPMQGSASSMNVACASSIILYEVDRQRRK